MNTPLTSAFAHIALTGETLRTAIDYTLAVMLGAIVEMVGLVGVFVGMVMWLRRARGVARLACLVPVGLYGVGQAVPIAMATDGESFARVYPLGLVLMTLGGLGGVLLGIRATKVATAQPRAWADERRGA